jgi:NDP-sugar pyrophosphorylase family protein
MEALLLAGGKAERLGEAAQGLPKPLVPVAGFPLAEYGVARLVAAGVDRVIVACRAGQEESFVNALGGLGAEIDAVGEAEPLGRGGGLKLAASRRRESGTCLAMNGDELLDVDFTALLAEHDATGAAATIVVAQVRSPFGVVELQADGAVTGFREAPLLDDWVNSGVYALGDEAIELLPERGDHEQSTFPELAAAGRLRGYRHKGVWLTVNTPKDLTRAADFMEAHPEWRPHRR